MGAHTQVDLADAGHPVAVVGVDEQPDLHSVTGGERNGAQQFPGAGVFASERLQHRGEIRLEGREQRPGNQFGDAAASVGVLTLTRTERASIEALHQLDVLVDQQRSEQFRHEHRIGIDEVGVDKSDEIAGGGGQRTPQDFTFTANRLHLGNRLFTGDHLGTGRASPLGGGVGRARVEHHEFIDQGADEWTDRGDHIRDGVFLVQRRQDHRHRAAAFCGHQLLDRPVWSVPAVIGGPLGLR